MKDYKLATDLAEMDRLAIQHQMWCLLVDGLYPRDLSQTVEEILKPHEGRKTTILDVGCGSGIWAMEMAKQNPSARVVGFDLVQQRFSQAPVNFEFVLGDITTSLLPFKGQADIVHCRCVVQHVKDPQSLVALLADTLKPNGLLLIADGDWIAYDENKQLVSPVEWDKTSGVVSSTGKSWYAGWLSLVGGLTRSNQYRRIDELVKACNVFSRIEFTKYFSPVNWAGENLDHGAELGMILNTNQRAFLKGSRDTLLGAGMSPDLIDEWARKYELELEQQVFL
ncbi:hypothetical protein VNI00_000790 [Paramarasmius palmivorus]|uniref:Methyltransferase domain-containing protein n=1 Tax=Paramarasmius palmivorus TaxID=297713 RepID=A0AAW0E9W3_9AGAR